MKSPDCLDFTKPLLSWQCCSVVELVNGGLFHQRLVVGKGLFQSTSTTGVCPNLFFIHMKGEKIFSKVVFTPETSNEEVVKYGIIVLKCFTSMTAYYVSIGSQVLGSNLHLTYPSHLRTTQKPTLESMVWCLKISISVLNEPWKLFTISSSGCTPYCTENLASSFLKE